VTVSLDPFPASRGPSPGERLAVCVMVWLMLAVISFYETRFEPIFKKLDEKGELPLATNLLRTFSHYDQQSYYLLSGLVLLQFLALDELVQRVLRLNNLGEAWAWAWFAFFLFSGLCMGGMLLFSLVGPFFKMGVSVS
jgi:hypothetical protein